MQTLKELVKSSGFSGELDDSAASKEKYSHDASLFEIKPELIVYPKNTQDVEKLVKLAHENKKNMRDLSLTPRSAGTDMAGGAINDSIILDFTKHMHTIHEVTRTHGRAQPGVYYRDFEPRTLKHGVFMPSYPASRDLAALGGMVGNNSGGEKSLEYGKVKDFVTELEVVWADGVARKVKPITKAQLDKKMKQKDFEGQVHKQIYELCEKNYDVIKNAKPQVSKNSMGYTLWEVWDRETGIFDLTKLFVGAQGTLGITTDITFKLVPHREHSGLLVLFLKDTKKLGKLIPAVLEHKPATFESFDDATLLLSIKFMPYFLKMLGLPRFIKLLFSLLPDALQLLKGVPKMVLMIEFNGDSEEEVRAKIRDLHQSLYKVRARYEINGFEETPTAGSSEKFWTMRRHSFQLLRSKVKDKHTAPFIDDLIVRPEYLAEFLPKLRRIVKKYKLFATVQGHIGDGNFHIIPLMKLEDTKERKKLLPAMKEVNNLVLQYKGSLSGEHNDGLVRGPWLKQQFGPKVFALMQEVKHIMDPQNIFNPHKKTDASWDYSYKHIRDHF